MWTWSQGAGLVIVEGKLTEELEEQGINTEQFLPFVVTDPHYVYAYGETNTYVVASFLGGYVIDAFARITLHASIRPVLNSVRRFLPLLLQAKWRHCSSRGNLLSERKLPTHILHEAWRDEVDPFLDGHGREFG